MWAAGPILGACVFGGIPENIVPTHAQPHPSSEFVFSLIPHAQMTSYYKTTWLFKTIQYQELQRGC